MGEGDLGWTRIMYYGMGTRYHSAGGMAQITSRSRLVRELKSAPNPLYSPITKTTQPPTPNSNPPGPWHSIKQTWHSPSSPSIHYPHHQPPPPPASFYDVQGRSLCMSPLKKKKRPSIYDVQRTIQFMNTALKKKKKKTVSL